MLEMVCERRQYSMQIFFYFQFAFYKLYSVVRLKSSQNDTKMLVFKMTIAMNEISKVDSTDLKSVYNW